MDPRFIDDLSQRLYRSLPENLRHLQTDLKQNLRSTLEASLSKLNLVTREEFEVQQLILQKCQKQIKELKTAILSSGKDYDESERL